MRIAVLRTSALSLAFFLLGPAVFAGQKSDFVQLFSADCQRQVGKSFVIDSDEASDLFLKLIPAGDGKPKGTVQIWTLKPDPKKTGVGTLSGPVQMGETESKRLPAGLFYIISPVPEKTWFGKRPDFERDFVIWSELDGQAPPDGATRFRVRRVGGDSGDNKLPLLTFVKKGSESTDTDGAYGTKVGMEGGIWGLKIPGTFGSH